MLAIVKNVITIKVLGQGRAWEPGPPWCFLSHLTQNCHLIAISCSAEYLQVMLATNTFTIKIKINVTVSAIMNMPIIDIGL